jgi:DNA-binding SARP family transcriptional activator
LAQSGTKVGETLQWSTWVQLCGRPAILRDGVRVEARLPGRKGVCALAYLAANADRWVTRDELIFALWGDAEPPDPDTSLASLLSKVRRVLGKERIDGRSSVRFIAADDVFVDVHVAVDMLHTAQAHLANGRAEQAWQKAHTAYAIARRTFLLGYEAPWIDEWRARMGEVELWALECHTEAILAIGELAEAERVARSLVERAPFRESGYQLLMSALERTGNQAEALRVYDRLRCLLADELGAAPGPEVSAVHQRLLRAGG